MDELSLLADNTQRSYKQYFSKYLEHQKITAEKLYLWQKRLLDDGDPRTNREVVRNVTEFIRHMISEGSATGTAVVVVNSVKNTRSIILLN
jgi:hypothetical protein